MIAKLNEMYAIMQEHYPEEKPSEIYGRIADELDRILAVRQFNSFAAEAMSMEDYEKVKNYAVNDFFARQTQADKETITFAYAKVERGTAGRYDLQVVMDYWKACLREYESKAKADMSKQK